MGRWGFVAVLGLAGACGGGSGASPDPYTFATLQFAGAYATGARGINEAGEVAAYYQASSTDETDTHALLWIAGTFTQIDPPTAIDDARGMGINASTTVVGSYQGPSGQTGFLRTAGGAFTDVLYTPSPSNGTTIRGVNDAGDLAGEWDDASDVRHGFTRIGGTFASVDVPGAPSTRCRDINNAGQVVGHYDGTGGVIRGFLLSGGSFTLVDFPGATSTFCGGINDAGVIVGLYVDAATGARRGYVLQAGTFTAFDVPGAMETLPTNINNAGVIVGEYVDADGVRLGFIATPTS